MRGQCTLLGLLASWRIPAEKQTAPDVDPPPRKPCGTPPPLPQRNQGNAEKDCQLTSQVPDDHCEWTHFGIFYVLNKILKPAALESAGHSSPATLKLVSTAVEQKILLF